MTRDHLLRLLLTISTIKPGIRSERRNLLKKKKNAKGDVTEVMLFNTADGELCKIATIDGEDIPSNSSPVRCYSANDYETVMVK